MKKKGINITQPSLPPLEEFIPYLEKIWDSKWLTNNGPFHQQLEKNMTEFLGVEYLSLCANGTLALLLALKALEIKGEVITTPFSFVATAHSILWNNCEPVFCDIEEKTLNLDPDKIEKVITEKTTAIVPVYVYGNPCNVNRIQEIADTYGLKIIYDAAHAFGVEKNGNSVLNYGDLSILSFHATKVFNTFEGGAIICHDEKMKQRIDYLKNFGFADEVTVVEPGINAKMNEIQAAYGLLQLKSFDEQVAKRKIIAVSYRELLKDVQGISFLKNIEGVKYNYAYFPIFVDKKKYGLSRDKLYEKLKKYNVFGRRYFYPLISHFSPYKSLDSAKPENMQVAERIAEQVISLPIYPDLELEKAEMISDIIIRLKG